MYRQQFLLILARAQRALERMRRDLCLQSQPLQLRYATTQKHLRFAEKDSLTFAPLQLGQAWGRSADLVWQTAWIEAKANLKPQLPSWQQQVQGQGAEIAIELHLSGEGLVFDAQGNIIQGISGGSLFKENFQRSLVRGAHALLQDGQLEIWVEAAANSLFGLERSDDPARAVGTSSGTLGRATSRASSAAEMPAYYGEHIGRVHAANIVLFDASLWHYLLDLESATQLAETLLSGRPASSWSAADTSAAKVASVRAKRLMATIDRALSFCAMQRQRVPQAHRLLLKEFANGNAPSDLTTVAVGHAHIDTGWLWPVAESVRKCARTFANQLRLMQQYPNYIFGASQAQHYLFVQQHYPELYAQIKQRVAEGRWEVQGGMWVEADANLPSGESLVRQLLHGKNFWRDEFGLEIQNLWLPDVFGYSANLPQILRRAGITYFLTQKLSWNQYNQFPHHTFCWHGIDGSSVLTHFPPENTYNSTMALGGIHGIGLCRAQSQYKEAHFLNEFLTLFGVGDGGGGPDEAMLEQAIRLGAQDVKKGNEETKGVEGTPRVVFGRADTFFEQLANHKDELATWQGELYLELHRGTLTTQAKTKWGNRRLEQSLRITEYLYSLSYRQSPSSYPKETLDTLWKTLLLNQFHDIIPGSSIHEVYLNTWREHAEALATCEQLLADWQSARRPSVGYLGLVNPYSLPVQVLVALPEGWSGAEFTLSAECAGDCKGQWVGDCEACEVLGTSDGWALLRLAPQAITAVKEGAGKAVSTGVSLTEAEHTFSLENQLVLYVFGRNGQLLRAYDKQCQREIISPEGRGNRLRLYADWPCNWDAWDIDINYQAELLCELQAETAEPLAMAGNLCRALRFTYVFGDSSQLEQTISLEAHSKRLNFVCRVDWGEKHRMLRVSFEANTFSPKASYDIQYGYLERPTHRNTSWEMAQFEVVGQRYADLSDYDYGVSLLNDSKYGYQSVGNWLDLNLLRSPTLPDPDADCSAVCGTHQFTYALLPHTGNLQAAMPQVQAEAALLNQPVLRFEGSALGELSLPIQVVSDNVTLEVLKKAEKSQDLVVRLVERAGRQSRARLNFYGQLVECDLMEWRELTPTPNATLHSGCELTFEPFAIRSFLLKW